MWFFQNIINLDPRNGGVVFPFYGLLFLWLIVIGMDIVGSLIVTTYGAVYEDI